MGGRGTTDASGLNARCPRYPDKPGSNARGLARGGSPRPSVARVLRLTGVDRVAVEEPARARREVLRAQRHRSRTSTGRMKCAITPADSTRPRLWPRSWVWLAKQLMAARFLAAVGRSGTQGAQRPGQVSHKIGLPPVTAIRAPET